MPARRCNSDAVPQTPLGADEPPAEDIEAYRSILNEGRRPTLSLVAERVGVKRQTVWQMEQHAAFRAGLVGSLRGTGPASGISGLVTRTRPSASTDVV